MGSKPDSEGEKVNILLVDDRIENLFALQAVLDRPDYNLVTATTGSEALGKLLKQDFALILLDVFMPGMDGYGVAAAIKSREKTRHIPIIFLTAMAKDIQTIYKAYDIGAVDFIPKPLEPYVVKAKVAVFAELHKKTRENKLQAELLKQSAIREKELQLIAVKQESEKKFKDFVEGINQGIVWAADSKTFGFTYVSPKAENILNYPLSQWFSEKDFWINHIYPEDRDKVLLALQRLKKNDHIEIEHRFLDREGKIVWFHTGARLAQKGQNAQEDSEIRGISINISTLKQTEEALLDAVRLRDEFLSIASHELKTPITPLKLQTQTLARAIKKLDLSIVPAGAFLKTVETLNRQIDRLSALVDSLLDVSRITSGRLHLIPEECNLVDMVHEVVDRYSDQLSRVNCKVQITADQAIHSHWDRLRIEQVIINLLMNAIKYGAGKPVKIHLSSHEKQAKISIRDQGIGIDEKDQNRIFQRFERATSPSQFGGLGLGLYITRQIVEAHGGSIYVDSKLGEGSTFTVELPLHSTSLDNTHQAS